MPSVMAAWYVSLFLVTRNLRPTLMIRNMRSTQNINISYGPAEPVPLTLKKQRNASLELLRLVSMFFIVFYHLISQVDNQLIYRDSIAGSLILSLHVGVICFVLISGYFGIKYSWQRILRFFIQILFYNVLIYFLSAAIGNHAFSIKKFVETFMPIARNQDLWYIRTYFMLMLLIPLVNKILPPPRPSKCNSSMERKNIIRFERQYQRREFLIVLISIAIMSLYIGTIGNDPSLRGGKNIVNFILLYYLGNEIRVRRFLPDLSLRRCICYYVLFNAIITMVHYCFFGTKIASVIMFLAFGYNSPLLIINGIFLFLIFSKLKISSKPILWASESVFAIYLIHSNLNVQNMVWPLVHRLCGNDDNLLFKYFLCSIVIMILCIIIDKLLSPIYSKIFNYLMEVLSRNKFIINNSHLSK